MGQRIASPFTFADYAKHKTQIDKAVIEGSKLVLFAHSQGNLFANKAYDYALAKVGSSSVKMVHVAPASAVLRGNYTLANNDIVINALLRLTGSVPTPNVETPAPAANPDFSGHGLFGTYLKETPYPLAKIRSDVQSAFATVVAPPQLAQAGFFTVTLTWNGSGDVDLHTFEPSGSHVYYAARQGTSGRLDYDNTVSNGPEHYYASCSANSLRTGNYSIGVNNFAQADGRTATIEVSSSRGGTLTTRASSV